MGFSGKQKMILGLLGLVLVLVWGRALIGRPRRAGPKKHPATFGTLALPAAGKPVAVPAGPVPEVPPGWGESPFLSGRGASPVGETVAGPSGERPYQLNGILWDPQRPSAIINNQVVSVGDRLHGWQVMEIKKDRVVLSDGATTRELTLSE